MTDVPHHEPELVEAPPVEVPLVEAPLVEAPLVEVPWRRLSSRMLLVHPVREVGRFIPILIGIVLFGGHNGNGHWWGLIGVVLVIGASIMRWATTSFQITPDQVQLRTGLFRKRILTTPADRVRTVDVTEHALHRLLGLAKVSIGTGISDEKKSGMVLDGLSVSEARSLRGELLHRTRVSPQSPGRPVATAPEPLPEREDELLRLDPSWMRYAPFTFSGAITGLAIVGVSFNALGQSDVDASKIRAVQDTSRHLERLPLWLSVIQVTLSLLAVVALLSIIGYVLSFWNFRLTRHSGGTLQVTRGLLTTRSTSIEHRRLRGVEISEPIFLRAVRGARLVAVATGLRMGRGSQRGGTVLAPPAPSRVIADLAGTVLGEIALREAQRNSSGTDAATVTLVPHPARARRRRINRAITPWLLLVILLIVLWATAGLPKWFAVAAAVGALLAIPIGVDRYRSLGHRFVDGFLVTRYGSLVRRRVVLEADGIIGWNERRTFFQRRARLVSLIATTAAGGQHYAVPDLAPEESLRLARQATPGLLEPFLR
ncbi:putative membrane protein [Jatrophihabitans sp. GAS493]|uniref:PH domain-containing protein n=1 Tax=Jatrophihabitans sp. GAS493 TaxID=1907575 RepID=UPI000BBF4237|nr:PH domain-containing protein [Jatrophihabitans sp. GAS493]SOD70978.1 putative membrane protein [Jatrophihabitans sp. GAS493]